MYSNDKQKKLINELVRDILNEINIMKNQTLGLARRCPLKEDAYALIEDCCSVVINVKQSTFQASASGDIETLKLILALLIEERENSESRIHTLTRIKNEFQGTTNPN